MIAVVDPELMLSVPRKFTAYQGFDALFHNMGGLHLQQGEPLWADGAARGHAQHRGVAAGGRA